MEEKKISCPDDGTFLGIVRSRGDLWTPEIEPASDVEVIPEQRDGAVDRFNLYLTCPVCGAKVFAAGAAEWQHLPPPSALH